MRPSQESQARDVVADFVFLSSQGISEASSELGKDWAHCAGGDNLVMMGFEEEEHDTGDENDVPFLKYQYRASVSPSFRQQVKEHTLSAHSFR